MIDAEHVLYTLLEAGKPAGATVQPERDLDSIEHFPLVMFNVYGNGQTSNGPGIWNVTLDLTVIGGSIDEAKATAAAFYDLVWSWDADPLTAAVDGAGWVQSVSDVSYFSRAAGSAVNVRGASQYDGSFDLELRN